MILQVRNSSRNVFICLFICVSASAQSLNTLTVQNAVEEALRNSPKVQRAESVYREASWKKTETYSGYLPALSFSGSYLFDKKYALVDITMGMTPLTIPQVVPTTNFVLNAQWSLFDGFRSTHRYWGATAFAESAKDDFAWTRFQIEREVVVLFYKAVAAKELKAVAEQNVRALEDHLKDVRLYKKVGSSTNLDVLRVEVQMSEAQSELMNATDNLELSKARLSEALGQEEDVPAVAGKLPQLKAEVVTKLTKFDIENRKDLRSLQNRSEGLRHQEEAAERYLVPHVSLFGQYQYYNNRDDRFDDYDRFRDAYQYGVMLTWNLFDGMASIAKSKQSVEQKYQAERTLRQALLKAQRDFDFWKRKYVYFCSVYEARKNDILKAQESVRLSRAGQRAGARTNTDVLDAEAELFRARAGAVNAQIGALEAIANLELSTGEKLISYY